MSDYEQHQRYLYSHNVLFVRRMLDRIAEADRLRKQQDQEDERRQKLQQEGVETVSAAVIYGRNRFRPRTHYDRRTTP